MTSAGTFFRYDASRWPEPDETRRTGLPPWYMNETISMIERLAGRCPHPEPWASDLMEIARAAYLADKLSRRSLSDDGWTRQIDLSIQLLDPSPWQDLTGDLAELLGVLTADRWTIRIRGGGHGWNESLDVSTFHPTEVALFSGGLDSAAYVASVARRPEPSTLLAVSHCHNHEKRAQERVWDALDRLAPGRLHRIPFRQIPHVPRTVRELDRLGREYTTRTRGLLLTAAGVYAAAAHGVDTVAVPENGQLAVNPALTPNRVGSCSTRTVHPLSLYLLNRLIGRVGGGVRLYNPLWRQTKTEVCRSLYELTGRRDLLAQTLSCSKASSSQQSDGIHCGCCWACLARRAALTLAVPGGDPTKYQRAPWTPDGRMNRHDLVALLYWLDRPFTAADLTADLPLPPDQPAGPLLAVIDRGRTELRAALDQLIPNGSPYRDRLTGPDLGEPRS